MSSSKDMLAAHADERIYPGDGTDGRERRRRALAVAVAAIAYGGLLTLIAVGVRMPEPAPEAQEIPVEIVAEPPPPPPPPPQQAQQPAQSQPLDEKPAFEAPKGGTSDNLDATGDKARDNSPPPPPPAQETSPATAAGANDEGKAPEAAALAPPAEAPALPIPPLNSDEKGEIAPPPKAEPAPDKQAAKAKSKSSASKLPSTFDSVPDVDFGGAAARSIVAGGKGPAHYTNVLYGLIHQHYSEPPGARAAVGRGHGRIAFGIDGQGRLVGRIQVEESGSPELDRAYFDAIGAASPFPPPPSRSEMGLTLDYP